MSESSGTKTERGIGSSIFVLAVSVVLLRVWYVAEQLRTHHPSTHSTKWTDANGVDHTLTMTTSPGREFSEFLVEFDSALAKTQRQYPRKP